MKKTSIGKKVLSLTSLLIFILVLICVLNFAALIKIGSDTNQLNQEFDTYNEVLEQGNEAEIQKASEDFDYIVEHINIRVSGTKIFNIALIVLGLLIMVLITIVVKKTIANPAKNAGIHLAGIVDGIKNDCGDLTTRIRKMRLGLLFPVLMDS